MPSGGALPARAAHDVHEVLRPILLYKYCLHSLLLYDIVLLHHILLYKYHLHSITLHYMKRSLVIMY